MQLGSTEHAAKMNQLAGPLSRGMGTPGETLHHFARHMTTLTFGLVFLMGIFRSVACSIARPWPSGFAAAP